MRRAVNDDLLGLSRVRVKVLFVVEEGLDFGAKG